jgi:hypothetical protein
MNALSAYFQESRGDSADDGIVRNVADDHCIRADDHVIAHGDPSENLGARTELHPVADSGCSEGIVRAAVSQRHAVTNQAIVADDAGSMDDNATMVLDGEAPADRRGRADTDAAEDFGEFVEHDVNDGPRHAQKFVSDHESGVTKAVHEERPKSQAQQSFALRFEVFDYDVHRGFVGVSMDCIVGGVRH